MKDLIECGRPIRRRHGTSECILEAGHRAWWCQDQRALDALRTLDRVEHLAQEARSVLGLFGCAMGRGDTERWILHRLWSGELTLSPTP